MISDLSVGRGVLGRVLLPFLGLWMDWRVDDYDLKSECCDGSRRVADPECHGIVARVDSDVRVLVAFGMRTDLGMGSVHSPASALAVGFGDTPGQEDGVTVFSLQQVQIDWVQRIPLV
jgi:hypothetical protein